MANKKRRQNILMVALKRVRRRQGKIQPPVLFHLLLSTIRILPPEKWCRLVPRIIRKTWHYRPIRRLQPPRLLEREQVRRVIKRALSMAKRKRLCNTPSPAPMAPWKRDSKRKLSPCRIHGMAWHRPDTGDDGLSPCWDCHCESTNRCVNWVLYHTIQCY